jgi:hypothetical protein
MRKIWLQKPNTLEIWDLLPTDALDRNNASPFLAIKGMGYKQEVTQNQVNTEYFVSKILTKNQSITGIMYFQDDEHIKAFQEFVGDFREQLILYYSPSGEYEPYDRISAPFYKKVIISQMDKTEMDEFGWYQLSTTLSTQDDVWNRDLYYAIQGLSTVGEALVYPYTYPYTYGGRNALAIDFNNEGREVGCLVKIKNNSDSELKDIEWFIEREYLDYYGNKHEEVQRSKWVLNLSPNSELVVDSNPITQEAKVNLSNNTSQSVADLQEPSYEYINFVTIQHGKNKIVFYIENEDIDIAFTYREQKEII